MNWRGVIMDPMTFKLTGMWWSKVPYSAYTDLFYRRFYRTSLSEKSRLWSNGGYIRVKNLAHKSWCDSFFQNN
jgi:hypothetical protein